MNRFALHLIISFISGALYALAYPSTLFKGVFLFTFLSLAALLHLLIQHHSFKRLFTLVTVYNLGLNLVGYYWIPHTLQEFGQLPPWISYVLAIFFSLILQPYLYVFITAWWAWKKFGKKELTPEQQMIIFAVGLTLAEIITPQQFPSYAGSAWLHVAPFLGLAPIGGIYLYSFVTYLISYEMGRLFRRRRPTQLVWSTLSIFLILNYVLRLGPLQGDKSINVRLVQANIGNFLKVESEKNQKSALDEVIDRYWRLSLLSSKKKLDLIIWPETAYPNSFNGKGSWIPRVFTDIMKKTNAELLIGGYDHHPEKSPFDFIESEYNSAILMSDLKVASIYHKNILIPFGETLPFGPLNKTVVNFVPTVSLFARGEGTPEMKLKSGHGLITPICYEILETGFTRSLLNQHSNSDIIVNLTNDSWYGETAEPFQHLFLAKWRALEFGRPIIRSTNTGISSVIFPDGAESPRLMIGEEKVLDVEIKLPAHIEPTIYQKFGISIVLLVMGMISLLIFWKKQSPPLKDHGVSVPQ